MALQNLGAGNILTLWWKIAHRDHRSKLPDAISNLRPFTREQAMLPTRYLKACIAYAAWAVLLFSMPAEPQTADASEQAPMNGARRRRQGAPPENGLRLRLSRSADRGAHWLLRSSRPDGLFVYGWSPAVNRALDDNNYLRQAGAAAALARAAGHMQDSEMAAAAQRAIIVLVETHTREDARDPRRRRPTLWSAEANPVGFSALLLWAVSELPDPDPALLEYGDQLARFLAFRQRPDGSINIAGSDEPEAEDSPEGMNYYPGEALYALMRSHARSPAGWKLATVERAFPFYRRVWREEFSAAFVPWQTSAYAEAFLVTGKAPYADFVFAMNDWLVELQYKQGAPKQWQGGFATFDRGYVLRLPPGVTTASCAESLVDAWRVARECKDVARVRKYHNALERAFQFLIANQYSNERHLHFEPEFRSQLDGAFHASIENGTVRIDFNQHAICGMFRYLSEAVQWEADADHEPKGNGRRSR